MSSLSPLSLLLVLVSVLSTLALDVHYVKPNEPSPTSCPGQPCLTLDQYAQQTDVYFVTGATFLFLARNHSLSTTVNLIDISDITLTSNDSDIYIMYSNGATIVCRNVTNLSVKKLNFVLYSDNSEHGFNVSNSKIWLSELTFFGGGSTRTHYGGAIYADGSNITLNGNIFSENSADAGGAIYAQGSTITLNGNNFFKNTADYGGAVSILESIITLNNNNFSENIAGHDGGAMAYLYGSSISMNGNTFSENNASMGGAVYSTGILNITLNENIFVENNASLGGAIYCAYCGNIILNGNNFYENNADIGGAILVYRNVITLNGNTFSENSAYIDGGAMYINLIEEGSYITLKGNSFYKNKAVTNGGAISIFSGSINFSDSEAAVSATTANTSSNILIGNNFSENKAGNGGGAVFAVYGNIFFHGRVTEFVHNSAVVGGALHTIQSKIFFGNTIIFTANIARYGGAIYLSAGATMTFEPHTNLITSHNHATEHGGVIFYEDTPTPIQCHTTFQSKQYLLPQCSMQIQDINNDTTSLNSYNDSAGKGGSCLYGGLLDKCQVGTHVFQQDVPYISILKNQVFHFHQSSAPEMTSEPYYLCFCDKHDCLIRVEDRQIYRGQEFKVSFLALAQGYTKTGTLLSAKMSSTASLKLKQSIQTLYPRCNTLSYNLFSTENQEKLTFYIDGPCHDTGLAKAIVSVTLLPCPAAFILHEDRCICEERLQVYDTECIIADQTYIKRKTGSRFWMSAKYNESLTYQGLILYKTCPVDYCKSDSVNISLDNLDIQCDQNRSGMLCGACATNYSLMLGSSKCQVCPNTYLALLVPFAAAGIALVVFLTLLRLTVATGLINSLILYANIVHVNKNILWPDGTSNFLTVFIAWLNLDLGIQTCFYDGMDAYAQTWLQFAFPVYVWSIICLIVFTSRYSITVSRLIGSNPIAVLATLLLMSYTKVLKVIITVYSSAELDYPDNKTVTVWFKDANVPYLQSKHLTLTVVTSLVFVFLFLPYTLLLLLGHKLYRYSNRKGLCWLNKIKPLLDSYYAPYKFHTRYWTGFLLLVRCALYVEFSLGTPTKSLLAIICTFTAIGMMSEYLVSGRVYSKLYINIIEASLYLNLVILSAATLADANSPALVYTLVGLAFATTVGIFVYHFHNTYTAKSALWIRFRAKFFTPKGTIWTGAANRAADRAAYTPLLNPNTASNIQRNVTQTVIAVREPLLLET